MPNTTDISPDLSASDRSRLQRAMDAFDAGDASSDLYGEFESLAAHGFTEALYFVGCMFEDGSNGQIKHYGRALDAYERSVEAIGDVASCLASARVLYNGGPHLERDYAAARKIYESLLQHREHLVACFMLGRMYHYGQGGPKDAVIAEGLYRRAIALGSVYGMLNLANLKFRQYRFLEGARWRVQVVLDAYRIAKVDRKDPRLRGG